MLCIIPLSESSIIAKRSFCCWCLIPNKLAPRSAIRTRAQQIAFPLSYAPPRRGFRDVFWHRAPENSGEDVRVVRFPFCLPVVASKELEFYETVQLPENPKSRLPEPRLYTEGPVPRVIVRRSRADLAMQTSGSVWMRNRPNLCVIVRVVCLDLQNLRNAKETTRKGRCNFVCGAQVSWSTKFAPSATRFFQPAGKRFGSISERLRFHPRRSGPGASTFKTFTSGNCKCGHYLMSKQIGKRSPPSPRRHEGPLFFPLRGGYTIGDHERGKGKA